MDLSALQDRLRYRFSDVGILETALTHSSYDKSERHSAQNNERLEFLGDAVLELCISKYLFTAFPQMSEGEMTRLRAAAVCESALFGVARSLGLGMQLRLSRGEERTSGRQKPSIVSDALEAVIGAIYLDGGIGAAESFILSFAPALIQSAMHGEVKDCKTRLQELLQQRGAVNIRYTIIDESGPDHDKRFTALVALDDAILGRGTGRSKKEAEQLAAEDAMAKWEE